jgi:glycosyltransferase involved in cell wall biosynthesis
MKIDVSESERAALRASGQFDEEWYLSQYPEVRTLGMDAATHFLWLGRRIGRKPGPSSDGRTDLGSLPEAQSHRSGGSHDPVSHFAGPADGVDQNSDFYISRFMHYIWSSRSDLQALFSLDSAEGRLKFACWYVSAVEREYNPPPAVSPDEVLMAVAACPYGDAATARRLLSQKREAMRSPNDKGRTHDAAGANLIGYAKGELGMGEHVRMVANSLRAVGVPYDLVNVHAGGHGNDDASADRLISQRQRYATNIFHINADMYPLEALRYGSGYYNIGYWAWELPECPPEFDVALRTVDEVWACSQFTADSIRTRASTPVLAMPLAVTVPALSPAVHNKARYGLPEDRFVFLFTFDASSYLDRKNPIDVVRAFKRAFPRGDEKVHLVLKVQNTAHIVSAGLPAVLWRALIDEIGDSHRISIIDKRLPREEVFGLSLACDAFVSLHRSEGFGRNLTEAMSYGKPVIATDFSGSREFVREDTACPIGYQLIPVPNGAYPYSAGQVWAQPDVDQAAAAMRRLFFDESFRVQKARAGQQFVRDILSEEVIGRRYAERLAEINSMPIMRLVQARASKQEAPSKRKTVLFTITSKQYLPYALTMLRSVAEIHPEFGLFHFLADDGSVDLPVKDVSCRHVTDINMPTLFDMMLRYDVYEFNTAVKPFVLQWLLSNTDADNFIYFDPDLYLYQRLDDVVASLESGASAILTPHVTEPIPEDDRTPADHDILQSGVFNLGFIAFRRCGESKQFIDWWARKLSTMAVADFEKNSFCDQRWCDFAPCFLPHMKVLSDPGYNVAYWNLPYRSLSRERDDGVQVNGRPLVFFHFSGINPTRLEAISRHQTRFEWSDLGPIGQKLFQDYGAMLMAAGWSDAKAKPYAYDTISDLPIRPVMRALYRAANPRPRYFGSAAEARNYLLDLCNRLVECYGAEEGTGITELMQLIYRQRRDLHSLFDLAVESGRRALREWFASSGSSEYGLPSEIEGIGQRGA